jgi:hypothetical protein
MLRERKRPSLIVRINFLLLGLGLTLYGMYGVNSHGVPKPLLTILGIDSAPKAEAKMCKTRVQGVIQPEKLKLMQDGNDWVAEGPQSHKVDFISVEKWLSKFCSAKLEPLPATAKADAGAGFTPTLFVKFIDGGIDVLRSAADGSFEWHGQFFRSEDLKNALQQLGSLSIAKDTTKTN